MKFSQLAERQIRKAQAEGQFDTLKGAGKPLDLSEAAGSTEAIGFRIMAEAGAVPREVDLRRQVQAQIEVLQAMTDPEARKREMARLADLQLRLEIEAEARRRFQGS